MTVWRAPDGSPIACREKLKMLEENAAELAQAMQDAFEDAVLMGVDEGQMRAWFGETAALLRNPRA